MLGEVVDPLLTEDHVRAALLHLVDHPMEHVLLLGQERVELARVVDLDLRVDLGLLDLEGRVQEGDPGLGDPRGHPRVDLLLVDDDALDERRVGHLAALLLDELDVVQVDGVAPVGLLGHRGDRLHARSRPATSRLNETDLEAMAVYAIRFSCSWSSMWTGFAIWSRTSSAFLDASRYPWLMIVA